MSFLLKSLLRGWSFLRDAIPRSLVRLLNLVSVNCEIRLYSVSILTKHSSYQTDMCGAVVSLLRIHFDTFAKTAVIAVPHSPHSADL